MIATVEKNEKLKKDNPVACPFAAENVEDKKEASNREVLAITKKLKALIQIE